MHCGLCTLLPLLAFAAVARGAESPALRGAALPATGFARVEVASTWTSIYVGTVSLKLPIFTREPSGDYAAAYAARVIPFFFYNETGRLTVRVTDDDLRRLARGEAIEFTGRAVNQEGEERRVTGKATPADATSGKIKVRVAVSPRIELIFNTTYRFLPP